MKLIHLAELKTAGARRGMLVQDPTRILPFNTSSMNQINDLTKKNLPGAQVSLSVCEAFMVYVFALFVVLVDNVYCPRGGFGLCSATVSLAFVVVLFVVG